jgi:hypothetical protein
VLIHADMEVSITASFSADLYRTPSYSASGGVRVAWGRIHPRRLPPARNAALLVIALTLPGGYFRNIAVEATPLDQTPIRLAHMAK